MNRLSTIGRLAVIVAGLAGALLSLCAGMASAAFAVVRAPLGGDPHGRPGLPAGRPAAPAAFASAHPPLPPGHIYQQVHIHQSPLPAPVHTVVIGGMPGWQIALIAAGAALAAAAVAILAARAWAAQRARHSRLTPRPYLAGPYTGKVLAQPGHRNPETGQLPASER
jgi:hypothetical protein